MDVSSTNVDWYDPQARAYRTKGLIYRNGTDTLEHFASVIRAGRMAPYLVSWNIGSTRQIITFLDMGWIAAPAYVCFCLTGDLVPAGHPGTAAGLDAHLAFLPRHHAVEWTACHYNGDLLGLTEKIIAAGGHVSIGLGDHPYLERGLPTNADLIHIVAEQARALGREIATPAEARIILGVPAAASAPVHA
jgi:uncharacterized protein (DUF849 family)